MLRASSKSSSKEVIVDPIESAGSVLTVIVDPVDWVGITAWKARGGDLRSYLEGMVVRDD